MKIGIVGLGFVGLSLAAVLGSKGFSVIGSDIDKSKILKIRSGKTPFYEPNLEKTIKNALKQDFKLTSELSTIVNQCKLVFITVGTPQGENGAINLTMVEKIMQKIGMLLKNSKNDPSIILKSTVIPGTTKKMLSILERKSGKICGEDFGLIVNPEFLRESQAIKDTIDPHVVVLGGINDKFLNRLKKFYKKLYLGNPLIQTNHETAEMIKYANNSFLATKISFINLIATICESIPGTNIDKIAQSIGFDPRIGNLFLNAGPGYGGSCLPKDIKAIINFSTKLGIKPSLFQAVESINKNQIEKIFKILKNSVGKVEGKTIAILGLAFKSNTDDVRDSVSIKLIHKLLEKGAIVKAHDPRAIENAKSIFGVRVNYSKSIRNTLSGSDCAIIVTPWNEYSKIGKNDIKMMKKRIIIDTRRILINKNLDLKYFGFGLG